MSIPSNISTAFFSDCNIFATPKDYTCTPVGFLQLKNGWRNARALLSSLRYRIAGNCSRELEACHLAHKER